MKLQEIKKSQWRIVGSDDVRSVQTVMGWQPQRVRTDFNCHNNKLTSLVGAPKNVEGDFDCTDNELTSLEGAPAFVGGGFYCNFNKLTSFAGIHKQIKQIGLGLFYARNNPGLVNNLVGLLLIDGLHRINIDNKEIEDILNTYLCTGNKKLAVLQCQQELIEAGFESAADL